MNTAMSGMASMSAIGGLNGMEGGASVNFSAEPHDEPRAPERSKGVTHVRPFTSVESAIAAVVSLDRELRKFELAVADSLQDYLGVQMAQITDCALARGWEPVSFMQRDGYRVYRYEAMRSLRKHGKEKRSRQA
ncbi:hypothetical protein QMO14_26465 [Variovorax sp. CAN2819]|uniref:hypothetical protein n=1 Tax=Variovorax sp. CAN15 TaxID=3046727 RepID=UPI002649750D|nr:hypothetical protein [Variovorax sp. CAN15]MDN6887131.1 hypothetical protein [Variovorax sp. CAN15]